MNKFSLALAMAGLVGADAVAGDPWAVSPSLPLFEQRANAALLFDAADRQAALADSLRGDGVPRYSALAGLPKLHFGALPDNLALLDPLGPLLSEHSKRFLSSAEFEKKMGRGTGILTVGLLREAGGAPGSEHSMSMMLNTRPTTTFTSVSLGYALTARSSLMAMASYGKTEGIGSPDSLLAQVSSVRTVAYSAGYVRRQLLAANDRLAVTLSIPAKVRTGSLEYSGALPQAVDPGVAVLGAPTLNLRPTATERDLELGYTRFFGRDGKLGRLTGALMWRVNPGHDATARPDVLTGVRYSYGF
ncbi:hypothetical protein GJ697_29075 [Pseudoduganella sp. FT25W]|uniref:DUF2219 family protein n=1 Tax=Duganella alba TaxID=2666081 RepID=A0A6L5QQ06_9BURK|nr:hypothetical protein [Duganella alba]MRX11890.1 hypothetical protein [Duganella alba]MRX20278.1 hypothetical protein [Duganella alba]